MFTARANKDIVIEGLARRSNVFAATVRVHRRAAYRRL